MRPFYWANTKHISSLTQIERAKYLDKLTAAERIHQRYAEDISRLQHQIKDYQSKLRSKETDDMFKLKEDNNRMRKDLNSFAQQTDDLKKLLKIMENDKERDARTSRANASRHAHHIESLQQELTKLHSKLQDKEKQINTLNLYSTHAAERKHLRSRTAEEKKYNTFSEAATPDDGFRKTISFNEDQNTIQHIQKNYEDMKPVIEEKHPYTDALLQSIMNKGAAAPKPKSPEPAPRSPEPAPSSFHKPNLGYTKTEGSTESVKAGVDTVEDILARRMREQIMSQSSNS